MQARETGGNQGFAQHALNGGPHKNRLVGQHRHLQLRRNRGKNPGKSGFDGVDDSQRGGFAGPGDAQHHAASSVRAHNIALDGEAVPNLRHILHVDRRAIHRLDRQVVQFVETDGLLLTLI